MRDDFDILTYQFPRSKHGIDIIPISDIHLGAAECMESQWKQFCDEILKRKNAYIILNGDLINNATRNSVSDVYAEVLPPHMQKDKMAEYLAPIKDKILLVTEGNHELRTAKDCDSYINYDICCRLSIEDKYRPNAGFMIIRFDDLDKPGKMAGAKRPTYTLCATHGAGTTIKRFQDFASNIDNLDVMVVGHTHKPIVTKNKKLFIDTHNNKVSAKNFNVCVAGSWLDYGGYAMRKMYVPGANALQTIHLAGDHKQTSITMY